MSTRRSAAESTDQRVEGWAHARRVHMIGIGGCGMSALARMLRCRGAVVGGSDSTPSDATRALEAEGFKVTFDQGRGELTAGCDLVIASAAVKADNPELVSAIREGVETMTYAEALGRCMEGRTTVAIAGTHGKSTTAAMLGVALRDAGLDPGVIVGATCAQLADEGAAPTGFRLGAAAIPVGPRAGEPGVLIAESCEYNRSFHHHRPTIASISAVEADHLDIFGSVDAVIDAFREFARLVPPAEEGGRLLIAHEGAHRREICAGLRCEVETIGFAPGADWVVECDTETRRVVLHRGREAVAGWVMKLPGEHMAMNAAIACVHAIWLGAEPAKAARSLGGFRGLDRRMQLLGVSGGVKVYDDYGHHPTEIEATLRALREFERPEDRGGRLVCVFQPHQHSRTRFLLDEFAQAFGRADVVIVPQIYFVRDSEIEKTRVSAGDLVDRLRARGVQAMHLYPFDAIVEQLGVLCRENDLLVVMGAGPVWQVARGFMRAGEARRAG